MWPLNKPCKLTLKIVLLKVNFIYVLCQLLYNLHVEPKECCNLVSQKEAHIKILAKKLKH